MNRLLFGMGALWTFLCLAAELSLYLRHSAVLALSSDPSGEARRFSAAMASWALGHVAGCLISAICVVTLARKPKAAPALK